MLFTDFGLTDPYLGLLKAELYGRNPNVPVIDLFSDLPVFDIQSAAYLLAAYCESFAKGTVFLCVVDPGVGGDREAALVKSDGKWFVGPDNGLFNIIARRSDNLQWWNIDWRPKRISASFHGRDLFAPVAADLVDGIMPDVTEQNTANKIDLDWPQDLFKVVYIDHYGNVITGVRANQISQENQIAIHDNVLSRATTFCDVAPGQCFWYQNSNGLLELACNQQRASDVLKVQVGDIIRLIA